MKMLDMLIIGGGPGGYTAALYAARAGLTVAVVEKLSAGGQMALTEKIDNYPGFPEGVDGFELGELMQQQAEKFGAQTILAEVTALELQGDVKKIHTSEGTLEAKTVVIATGANPRKLGLPGEEALTGRNIHYCAACDGMRYRGKTVAIVGGGNSAAADALALSRVAKKVILIHRRDTLRAAKMDQQALMAAENVEIRWNSVVSEIRRDGQFSGIVIHNVQSGEKSSLDCDGLFVSIGRQPATEFLKNAIALDPGGYIPAGESTVTAIPGVFAVGDVRTKQVRQIVTAVADGAVAVAAAEQYLLGSE